MFNSSMFNSSISAASAPLLTAYQSKGYCVVSGLFSDVETRMYRDHYMKLRAAGTYPGDLAGVVDTRNVDTCNDSNDTSNNDPLKRYPRMIHMHHHDDLSRQWMLDARLNTILTLLTGREPIAVQTMLYFKPAGARGQAVHQDNYYLRVQPGSCIAAWMALDDCDEENGCMRVVPGSHAWPLLCTVKADTTRSFTDVTVPIPDGTPIDAVTMRAGDVLFFNGQLVHGSFPNTSADRFRRSLIAHYIEGDSQQVAQWYSPAIRMDGTAVEVQASDLGGMCGNWVEQDGMPVIALTGQDAVLDVEAK